ADKGAQVLLVLGPSSVEVKHANVQVKRVESAEQMHDACVNVFEEVDIAVMSAAVADYKPEEVAGEKIKKQDGALDIKLGKTKDILAELGKKKKVGQLLVGFALETNNEEAHAREKLERKNADFIVLNSLNDEGAGFGHDTNKVTLIGRDGFKKDLPLMTKKEVAHAVVQHIIDLRYAETTV
ncbi:MAG: phosphopantothenoylcysteine decarboxylase, partial [Chitinophagaceae bacterium]|nr:phosphopantothenoylcysteine decarboxylase [Chitinophagaceae bacterium]